jgi:hypothetical protein
LGGRELGMLGAREGGRLDLPCAAAAAACLPASSFVTPTPPPYRSWRESHNAIAWAPFLQSFPSTTLRGGSTIARLFRHLQPRPRYCPPVPFLRRRRRRISDSDLSATAVFVCRRNPPSRPPSRTSSRVCASPVLLGRASSRAASNACLPASLVAAAACSRLRTHGPTSIRARSRRSRCECRERKSPATLTGLAGAPSPLRITLSRVDARLPPSVQEAASQPASQPILAFFSLAVSRGVAWAPRTQELTVQHGEGGREVVNKQHHRTERRWICRRVASDRYNLTETKLSTDTHFSVGNVAVEREARP